MTPAAIHSRKSIFSLIILVVFLGFSGQLAAAQCTAASGSLRTPILELYTSEGCSSCPPADRWLSNLVAHPSSSERVIPLALHVDYWDYIGWKDRFAQAKFSARQREMARLNHSALIYTPQVVLNGKDFRSWNNASFSHAVSDINQQPAQAWITLTLLPSGSNDLLVTAQARAPSGAALYVAVYENGLQSEIKAGENQGRRLQHDRVVRQWYGPLPVSRDGRASLQQIVHRQPEWMEQKMGVVAFVQDQTSGEILQAMRLAWCRS
ncbi:MAG: DUF1223 domain-containing protein [Sulfuriferula sp.]